MVETGEHYHAPQQPAIRIFTDHHLMRATLRFTFMAPVGVRRPLTGNWVNDSEPEAEFQEM